MSNKHFFIYAIVIGIIQMLIDNFLHLSQLLDISLLPLLVFCLPKNGRQISNLIAAFLFGLILDFTAGSVVGITSCALLLCVFVRPMIQKDHPDENKLSKDLILSITLLCAVFFLVYTLVDGAGTLRWGYLLLKWIWSTLCSAIICIILKVTALKEL